MAVVEEGAIAGGQDDQHALLGLRFAALNLSLQVPATLGRDGLPSRRAKKTTLEDSPPNPILNGSGDCKDFPGLNWSRVSRYWTKTWTLI